MAAIKLFDYQMDALSHMKNGCILNGGVGSGKSRTSLAYYYQLNGGKVNASGYVWMKHPCNLYIITTARKRDTLEWEGELAHFLMSTDPSVNKYENKIVVDSWNNIGKYTDVENSFFIFDEQRVVGYGAWTKAFLHITFKNKWILLSATPGDTWMDYIPVFIANGFYLNKSDFIRKHVIYSRYTKYPKVDRYLNTGRLLKLRNDILVNMDFKRDTIPHHETIFVDFNRESYKELKESKWNPYKNKPIKNAGEYCLCLRRLVNSDISRQKALIDILKEHPKAIIFYSYDYELDILREMFEGKYTKAEWNGHKHEPVPSGNSWVYLVEYTAGAEGWNCITTDTIIFYSQNYSYKVMQQASGRIDRLNTPYKDLYYYHLKSKSDIDMAIGVALKRKKKFNESGFAPKFKTEEKKGETN